jgi:hypothetical protein
MWQSNANAITAVKAESDGVEDHKPYGSPLKIDPSEPAEENVEDEI